MNQAQVDAHALQMWLVSSPFVLQQMMPYPQIQNPALMPYMMGQPPISPMAGNGAFSSNIMGGKKRKRKSKSLMQQKNEGSLAKPAIGIKEDTDKDNDKNNMLNDTVGNSGKTEIAEDRVNAEKESAMNGLHPAFNYATKNSLQAVMGRNTCRLCGKFFRSSQLLRQHMLVHTDQRKYQCMYCDRTFKQLSHLQQHHRIHTGEKPYKCQIDGCGRSFPQLSNLQHHYRNHDKPEPPSDRVCVFCDRTYCSEVVLRNHVMKIHLSNKKDPLLNQLTKDIKDIEQMEKVSTELSKDIGSVENTDEGAESLLNSVPLNYTSKFIEDTEAMNDMSKDLSEQVPLNGHEKDIGKKDTNYNSITDTVFTRSDPVSVRSKKEAESITLSEDNDDIFSTEQLITAFNLSYSNVKLDRHSDLSPKCLTKSEDVCKISKNKDSAKCIDEIDDKPPYDKKNMEEYIKKVVKSNGFVYNYTLDSISRQTEDSSLIETDSSMCSFDSHSSNDEIEIKTELCKVSPPLIGYAVGCPSGTLSEKDKDIGIGCEDEVHSSKTDCTAIHIAEEEKSMLKREDSFHMTIENTQGAGSNPVGNKLNLELRSNTYSEKSAFNASSQNMLPASVPASGSLSRARKRKAFVPQRYLVNGSL